jgi:tellurite resistance protein TehA-like permease
VGGDGVVVWKRFTQHEDCASRHASNHQHDMAPSGWFARPDRTITESTLISRTLDDPAWFGAVMGIGAVGAVAGSNPGNIEVLAVPGRVVGLALLFTAIAVFLLLLGRDIKLKRIGRPTLVNLKAPLSGPAYATIPGGINVIGAALVLVFPDLTRSTPGWILIAVITAIGTSFGLWLTVVFFAAAFEESDFDARDISGTWFIPETVVLLGALLSAELAATGPTSVAPGLAIVAMALLGSGGLLFALTAAILVNRLVLHAQTQQVGAAAMWIMMSPLSVAGLAVHRVAGIGWILSGDWEPAVQVGADLMATTLWGFALWWIAAASVVTHHVGREALRFDPSAWGYVFPSAAMTLATLNLARHWDSGLMELMGLLFGFSLIAITAATVVGSVRAIRSSEDPVAPTPG